MIKPMKVVQKTKQTIFFYFSAISNFLKIVQKMKVKFNEVNRFCKFRNISDVKHSGGADLQNGGFRTFALEEEAYWCRVFCKR